MRARIRASAALAGVVAAAALLEPRAASAQPAPLMLSSDQAVSLALDHNLRLQSARLGPDVAALDVTTTTTAWTPQLFSRLFDASAETPASSAFDTASRRIVEHRLGSEVGVAQRLPWGTSYRVNWTTGRRTTNSAFARFDPELAAGATATFVQPLLKGLLVDDARADRDVARRVQGLATLELKEAAARTELAVRRAYWSWVHARGLLAVQRQSLEMAQALLDGNRRRVEIGALAAVDVIEAEAEVARRGEAILVAEKNVGNAEDVLRALIFEPGLAEFSAPLEPAPDALREPTPGQGLVAQALADRLDLQAARQNLAIQGIEIRRQRHDSLPEVNLQADYGLQATGGRDVRTEGAPVFPQTFGSVLADLARQTYPAWSAQVTVSYPLGLGREEATRARLTLERRQAEAALKAAELDVATEVQAAAREAETNRRRLDTARTSVQLAERRLDAESRKFAAGLSTSFFVFQAQRDLSQAREAELSAVLDYHHSAADVRAVVIVPLP